MEQVADGARAGAIVEDSSATANDGLAVRGGSVREADARSEVGGNIMEVILRVVADTKV